MEERDKAGNKAYHASLKYYTLHREASEASSKHKSDSTVLSAIKKLSRSRAVGKRRLGPVRDVETGCDVMSRKARSTTIPSTTAARASSRYARRPGGHRSRNEIEQSHAPEGRI
eukprot:5492468-Prymnesium_polylepis.1